MSRVMAICDSDSRYAGKFADYANQKQRIPFTVVSFSSAERLLAYLQQQQTELVLIDAGAEVVSSCRKLAGQVILLSEGEVLKEHEDLPAVFKYQSSGNILREVMALYETEVHGFYGPGRSTACTITGVYSPVNRCGKTSFSLVYGQMLAKEGQVLYVNLEDYSGFARLLPRTGRGDFSDVLYYFKKQQLNQAKLNSAIHSLGELDYIPPVRYPEDLCETDAGELVSLLRQLSAEGGYHHLIVDIGQVGGRIPFLLDACDVLFMPLLEDWISLAKVEAFEEYLQLSGQQALAGRIRKLTLPAAKAASGGEGWLEQLLWGEMGDYVRLLMKGGDDNWYH